MLLFASGWAVAAVGFTREEQVVTLGCAAIGAGLVLAAALSDRLRMAELGPSGAKVELADPSAQRTSELVLERGTGGEPLPEVDEVVDAHRLALANEMIAVLTQPRAGPLANCDFQVHLVDADREVLSPILPPAHEGPPLEFAIGQGVAGRAYESGEFVWASGAEASDGTFGLSPEQQERFADVAAVAAMPVVNAPGQVIAVLSLMTRDPGRDLAADDAFDALLAVAQSVARILVDVLKWFSDTYDGSG